MARASATRLARAFRLSAIRSARSLSSSCIAARSMPCWQIVGLHSNKPVATGPTAPLAFASSETAGAQMAMHPTTPDPFLFPSEDERAALDTQLGARLRQARRAVSGGRVTPSGDRAEFRRTLAGFDFARPRPPAEAAAWAIAALEGGLVHMTHPRYFGLFNPAPTFPAEMADRIVAAFNPQLAVWSHAPAAVEIEAHVIRAVAARAGLPSGSGGHFTAGGAEANFTGLICALTAAEPGFGEDGVRAYTGLPVFYASRESHLAWLKIAHQAGIGRQAVRLIATDGGGRMDPAALERAIVADRAGGAVPVMVAATAGTTNAGMVDPLPACAAVAARHGLWFHVDAAWAGALIASPRHAGALAGLERADSATIDAHKWFATTMGCGMFLTSQPRIPADAFQVSTDYMPSNEPATDPYVGSVQWSRRFVGLRLFLSLAAAGWAGYATHVERAIGLAARLADALRAGGWRVVNDSPCAVVCAVPPTGEGSIGAIVDRVVASGEAWVSATRLEGRAVLRACITHGETAAEDVDRLAAMLNAQEQAIA
ncbi:MAG: pyridoxal-dependent decarboxylase [Alphaproteobacteria bacterium]